MDSVITISPTIATRASSLERFTLIRLCFTGPLWALLAGACFAGASAGDVLAAGAGVSFTVSAGFASAALSGSPSACAPFNRAFSMTS